MATANIQYWMRADITLKALADGSTKTLSFTNRPDLLSSTIRLPLLSDITGCGYTLGQDGMVAASSGTVSIIDAPHSFGHERRFSDLLERYAFTDQNIEIFDAFTDLNSAPTWVSRWEGKIRSLERAQNEVSLYVDSVALDTRKLGGILSKTDSYYVPDASVGKTLPIIFGSNYDAAGVARGVQVPAYPIGWRTGPEAAYAYASQVANYTNYGGGSSICNVFVRCRDNKYKLVSSPVSTSTGWAGVAGAGVNAPATASFGKTERGIEPVITTNTNFIITGGRWWFKGQSNAGLSPAGNLIFNLYAVKSTQSGIFETEPVAKAKVPKSDYYTELRGAANFFVNFVFDKPFIRGKGLDAANTSEGALLLTCTMDAQATPVAGNDFEDGGVNVTSPYYIKLTENKEWYKTTGAYAPRAELTSAYIKTTYDRVTSTNKQGYQFKYIALTQAGAPSQSRTTLSGTLTFTNGSTAVTGSGTLFNSQFTNRSYVRSSLVGDMWVRVSKINSDTSLDLVDPWPYASVTSTVGGCTASSQMPPDITNFDMVVQTTGVQVGVWFAGVADMIVERPDHVLKLLDYKFDGSNWVQTDTFDFSEYSSLYSSLFASTSAMKRYVSGATEAGATLDSVIKGIVAETGCQLVPRVTDSKLALIPWGSTLSVSKVFSDANCRVKSWNVADSSSVVNSVTVAFGRGLVNASIDATANNEGFEAYSDSIDCSSSSSALWSSLASVSSAIYGAKEVAKTALKWIGDAISANLYIRKLFSSFDHPHRTITIECGYMENANLGVGKVVEILSTKLPAYFGTSNAARNPTYNGLNVDILRKGYLTRANRYRCQIVGREINRGADSPTITFTLNVLAPYHPNDLT